MIKRIAAALSAGLILLTSAGCSLTKRDIEKTEITTEVPVVLTFLGDSIAAGYGLDGYTASDNYSCPDSYANILGKRYANELGDDIPHKMYNLAVSGDKTSDLIAHLETDDFSDALGQSNAVVISIGGNDLLGVIFDALEQIGLSAETGEFDLDNINIFAAASALIGLEADIDKALTSFEDNIAAVAESVKEKTDGDIYIQTVYNPLEVFDSIQMLTDFANEKIGRLNEIIKSSSAECGYRVIDVASEFEGRNGELTRINSFDIHPDEEGHAVIAELVDKSLRSRRYTFVTEEYGEPYLPLSTIMLILGGLCAMLAVVLIAIPKLFSKHEPEQEK